MLSQRFFSQIDTADTKNVLDNFISEKNLSTYSSYDICRGHDVIGLLGFVYGKDYAQEAMEQKMAQHYSKDDFYATLLFAEIQKYCSAFGIDAKTS